MTEFRESTPPPRTEQASPEPDWEAFLNGAAGTHGASRPGVPDLSQVFLLIDALRRVIPPELRDQFNALVREVLLTIRALIDWYLDRLERGPREPQVEDIPIE